jgi:23S rRNA pseudouridine1911/1915/1917 synthase
MKSDLFEVLEETDEYLVVNKEGDLVCHPTKGDEYSSLIGRLRLYYQNQPAVSPSFVNRLDRETSGVILIAKTPEFHARVQKLFQNQNVRKIYHAVVKGTPLDSEGVIDRPIGREPNAEIKIRQAIIEDGSASKTHWKLVKKGHGYSLLEIQPETGRLHQIRVHLASIGHYIVGDKLYGPDPSLYLEFVQTSWTSRLEEKLLVPRQLLHASELSVKDSQNAKEWVWKAPMPEDIAEFIKKNF